jgi:hypothetical protein
MDDSQQKTKDSALSAFATPYHEYTQRLAAIWEATTKQIIAAQRAFSDAGAGSTQLHLEDFQAAYDKGMKDYVSAIRACWEDSQTKYSEAYTSYLAAYRDAWASAELADLSPHAVNTISSSASLAAGYAASTIGNWSLIELAGVPPHVLMAQ